MKKFLLPSLVAVLLTAGVTSCSNEEPEEKPVMVALDFTLDSDLYNSDGYWFEVYNTEVGTFGIYPVLFSHKAESTQYDGVLYESFTGFCPSIVHDRTDHSGSDWTKYQFASYADPGMYGYLIAHWDVRENASTPLVERSCIMDFGVSVSPVATTITNTTYAYWVMKNGSAFSKPFTDSDYLALDIHGVNNGIETSTITVDLYKDGTFVENWKNVDLTPLGQVQQIFFTMRSSDTGEWGMNTPAYFAMGTINVIYTTLQ